MSKSIEAQLLKYLPAREMHVGQLINFTYPQATVKRMIQ
ncbi:MAG: hypothetical protein KQH63_14160 [Desulfobulbaceae bacterium]|nr:hypothetical protein [Desulfobulbaceae bacterium]